MLLRKLVVGTDNRTLEKAPNAFNAVRVNVAAYPFFASVDNMLVRCVRVRPADVRAVFGAGGARARRRGTTGLKATSSCGTTSEKTMPEKFLIDSDVCIDSMAGRDSSLIATIRRTTPEPLVLSVVTCGEVLEGVYFSRDPVRDLRRWHFFVSGFVVAEVTLDVADIWAQLRGVLRRPKERLEDNDLLIAATALCGGMTLVSRNEKHSAGCRGCRCWCRSISVGCRLRLLSLSALAQRGLTRHTVACAGRGGLLGRAR